MPTFKRQRVKYSLCRMMMFFLLAGLVFFPAPPAWGQVTHAVSGEAAVVNGNFFKARKKAVGRAMDAAIHETLRQLMGNAEYQARRKELSRMFADAEHYVKSYRFIEAVDDPEEMISRVMLEVTFYPEAVTQALSGRGIISGADREKRVVILINETSFTSRADASFWDMIPISEAALGQNFMESGFQVVGREVIRHSTSENTVFSAIKGSMGDAVNIGLKAGADIVIVGTSVSTLLVNDDPDGLNTIQANISVRAVSVLKSTLISAKSDFGSAKSREPLAGELEAFGQVGKKLADFLLPSIRRFWEGGATAQRPSRPSGPPLPLNDL